MVWFVGIVVVLVAGAVVVVASGRGGSMSAAYEDRPDVLAPTGAPLTGDAVRRIRFSVGFRGYRMDEVDALLARLADQLDDHDQRDDPQHAEELP